MLAQAAAVIYSAEIPDAIVTVAIGLMLAITTAGIGMMAWLLTTVVKLTGMIGVLEEKVRNLVDDIDELRAGNPEVRRHR